MRRPLLRTTALALPLLALACQPPPASPTNRLAPALECPPAKVLFLNFGGGSLTGNDARDDATEDVSTLVGLYRGNIPVQFPAFSGSAQKRQEILALVKQFYAAFNIEIVATRPASPPYTMVMVGGIAKDIGYDSSDTRGLALLDCGDQSFSDIAFAFAEAASNDPRQVAIAAAQEAAHAFGLNHVDEKSDIMYPQLAQQNAFHDRVMNIYNLPGSSTLDCSGGTRKQNDVELLNEVLGPACMEPAPSDGINEVAPECTGEDCPNELSGGCAIAVGGRLPRMPGLLVSLLGLALICRRSCARLRLVVHK